MRPWSWETWSHWGEPRPGTRREDGAESQQQRERLRRRPDCVWGVKPAEAEDDGPRSRPALNPVAHVLVRDRRGDVTLHMTGRPATALVWPQAKECQGCWRPPEVGQAWSSLSLSLQQEPPCPHLDLGLWPPDWERFNVCCVRPPSLWSSVTEAAGNESTR